MKLPKINTLGGSKPNSTSTLAMWVDDRTSSITPTNATSDVWRTVENPHGRRITSGQSGMSPSIGIYDPFMGGQTGPVTSPGYISGQNVQSPYAEPHTVPIKTIDVSYNGVTCSLALYSVLFELESGGGKGLGDFKGIFDFRPCFGGLSLTKDEAFDMFIRWWNKSKSELKERFDAYHDGSR